MEIEPRRQIDQYLIRMIEEQRNNLRDDIMELRQEVRDLRAELKSKDKEFGDKHDAVRQELTKHAATGNRMQVYVVIIAFILAQLAIKAINKFF